MSAECRWKEDIFVLDVCYRMRNQTKQTFQMWSLWYILLCEIKQEVIGPRGSIFMAEGVMWVSRRARHTKMSFFHSPCALYSFSPRALVCPLEKRKTMIPVSQATCASRVSRMFWWRTNIRHVECSRKLNLHHRIGYFETFWRSSNAEII